MPSRITPDERQLLARAMRRLRMERGLGLREAAALFGLDYSSLSRMENGQRWLPPADRIAEAFGVTVEDVLRPCPHCAYTPPAGFTCNRCGTASEFEMDRILGS